MVSGFYRLIFLLTALTLALVACPSPPRIEYKLVGLQPATVTPGAELVAFGVFPAQPQVTLAGLPVAVVPVTNGLRFIVPEAVLAGEQTLLLEGDGAMLKGLVTVNPRVDAVLAERGRIRVSGAGWNTDSLVSLNLDGRMLVTTIESNSVLIGAIPSGLTYGAFTVLLTANQQLSEAFTWNRQAGTVTGRVALPASGQALPVAIAQSIRAKTIGAVESKVLMVQHQLPIETGALLGLVAQETIPELGVTRLEFMSIQAASVARGQLQAQKNLIRSWFEAQVNLRDGLTFVQPQSVPNSGTGQWHLPLLGLDANYLGSRGDGVVVAVIDSGIELHHPDLQQNLLPGYDFVDNDALPQDIYGHGTHVAGLVAAQGAVAGVAARAKILPVRVLAERTGFEGNVAKGILWAAGILANPSNPNPAQVINLSLGGSDYPPLIDLAIKSALEQGVVIVAAAGNDGGAVNYPAAFPGVIAVSAVAGPELAYQPLYSSKGAGVWVTAYGGDLGQDQNADKVPDGLLSTDLLDPARPVPGYGLRNGTSMAAPLVAGMAALAISSGTPASLVRHALAGTATDLGVMGVDARFGYGLISTRVASPYSRRVYVAARRDSRMVAWTLLQADASFTLANLEPNASLELLAGSDDNQNGILGEAGELISMPLSFSVATASVLADAKLNLMIADGTQPVRLEVKP
jgi:serine protease